MLNLNLDTKSSSRIQIRAITLYIKDTHWPEDRRGILRHRLCGQPCCPLNPVLPFTFYVTWGKSLNLDLSAKLLQ